MKFIVITKVKDCANVRERADVTIGKPYEVKCGAGGPYFIDDAGDSNSGADQDNTVYEFDVYEAKKVCKCS